MVLWKRSGKVGVRVRAAGHKRDKCSVRMQGTVREDGACLGNRGRVKVIGYSIFYSII